MSKGDALIPILLLEACVTGGRTYEAYKRGGYVEARERGTEETLGAVFWIGGVPAFNKLGDVVGKKFLGVRDVNFDVGKDSVRKPFENYLQKMPKLTEKQLAAFKFTKIAASIVLSNAVIGFIVPKLNQAITRKYQCTLENLDKKREQSKNNKNPNFKGGGIQTLLSLTHNFENDSRYKLLSSDAGIAGGRAINARNKHERREALFRDLASIYFYMFCKNHIASMFNYLQDGRSTRIDPASVGILDNHLKDNLKEKSYSAEEFERAVMGDKNAVVPEKVQKEIKNGIITLEDFRKAVEDTKLREIAQKMSELQPKVKDVAIITSEQVKDIYTGGLINDPNMLKKVFEKYSSGKSIQTTAYYPEKDLRDLKGRMHDYIIDIIKKAKSAGENIDSKILTRANKMNLAKNAFNLTTGLAVSACFLATIIPKVQYWITQKTTGENKFPGVQKYDD